YRFDASITYELVDCSYCSAQDTGLTILMISEKSEPEKGFTLVQDNDANSPSYGEILFDDAQKVAEEQAAQFVILLTQFKIQHKDDQDISAVLDNFIRDLSQ
ncbi:MAG: hypothetical protein MJK04_20140, partial [Psychrosphaera sp.]|nr:hypothetical protein [Psychrosphaera sp.]